MGVQSHLLYLPQELEQNDCRNCSHGRDFHWLGKWSALVGPCCQDDVIISNGETLSTVSRIWWHGIPLQKVATCWWCKIEGGYILWCLVNFASIDATDLGKAVCVFVGTFVSKSQNIGLRACLAVAGSICVYEPCIWRAWAQLWGLLHRIALLCALKFWYVFAQALGYIKVINWV